MRICPNCGIKSREFNYFCHDCGTKLPAVEDTEEMIAQRKERDELLKKLPGGKCGDFYHLMVLYTYGGGFCYCPQCGKGVGKVN